MRKLVIVATLLLFGACNDGVHPEPRAEAPPIVGNSYISETGETRQTVAEMYDQTGAVVGRLTWGPSDGTGPKSYEAQFSSNLPYWASCFAFDYVENGTRYINRCDGLHGYRVTSPTFTTTCSTFDKCNVYFYYGGAYYGSERVVVEYTVTAQLKVTISGPTTVETGKTYTWTAKAEHGTGSYSYAWYSSRDGVNWDWISPVIGDQLSLHMEEGGSDFHLMVEVTSDGEKASDTHFVDRV